MQLQVQFTTFKGRDSNERKISIFFLSRKYSRACGAIKWSPFEKEALVIYRFVCCPLYKVDMKERVKEKHH